MNDTPATLEEALEIIKQQRMDLLAARAKNHVLDASERLAWARYALVDQTALVLMSMVGPNPSFQEFARQAIFTNSRLPEAFREEFGRWLLLTSNVERGPLAGMPLVSAGLSDREILELPHAHRHMQRILESGVLSRGQVPQLSHIAARSEGH